jgi:hypothetical protein
VRQEDFVSDPSQPFAPPERGKSKLAEELLAIEKRAEAGDFAAVLEFFGAAAPGVYSFGQFDRLLRRAIQQASRQSPAEFSNAMFEQMTVFQFYVTLRLQGITTHWIESGDANGEIQRGRLSEELKHEFLPAIQQMSRLLAELNLSWASATRLWGLAERGKHPQRRKAKRRRPPKNRLKDLFDGPPNQKPGWEPRNGRGPL